jgi:hypothetical protein
MIQEEYGMRVAAKTGSSGAMARGRRVPLFAHSWSIAWIPLAPETSFTGFVMPSAEDAHADWS